MRLTFSLLLVPFSPRPSLPSLPSPSPLHSPPWLGSALAYSAATAVGRVEGVKRPSWGDS